MILWGCEKWFYDSFSEFILCQTESIHARKCCVWVEVFCCTKFTFLLAISWPVFSRWWLCVTESVECNCISVTPLIMPLETPSLLRSHIAIKNYKEFPERSIWSGPICNNVACLHQGRHGLWAPGRHTLSLTWHLKHELVNDCDLDLMWRLKI